MFLRRAVFPRRAAVLVAAAALTATAACSSGDDTSTGSGDTPKVDTSASFKAGTTMAKLKSKGTIVIGTKKDQPGVAFQNAASGKFEGFDIEMAKIVASKLGLDPNDPKQVQFKEVVSKNRETFVRTGTIDIMIGSYSITDKRKKLVDFAGPYYVTGQQLLVKKDDDSIKGPEDLKGKKVCSVTGSTSIDTVETKYGANPVPFDTYTECVDQLKNGSVDAVTTDGAILLGFASKSPDELKVVGDAFSTENYGMGLKKGDADFRSFLNDTIEGAEKDGTWKTAFDSTLGKAGVKAPKPPKVDRY
ncbi:MAG: glutamate ABC transporter substrate-binding protein [Mycobacteriales bacterium]